MSKAFFGSASDRYLYFGCFVMSNLSESREVYPLSDEGRAAAAKYLAETYEADLERWKQHPSLLDCEPWTPPTPEEEASGQS